MNLSKKIIAKNISSKSKISDYDSALILEAFIKIVKKNSKHSTVKIPSFGTFKSKITSERVGRNPKTKEEYKILPRIKLVFTASTYIKKFIN